MMSSPKSSLRKPNSPKISPKSTPESHSEDSSGDSAEAEADNSHRIPHDGSESTRNIQPRDLSQQAFSQPIMFEIRHAKLNPFNQNRSQLQLKRMAKSMPHRGCYLTS